MALTDIGLVGPLLAHHAHIALGRRRAVVISKELFAATSRQSESATVAAQADRCCTHSGVGHLRRTRLHDELDRKVFVVREPKPAEQRRVIRAMKLWNG